MPVSAERFAELRADLAKIQRHRTELDQQEKLLREQQKKPEAQRDIIKEKADLEEIQLLRTSLDGQEKFLHEVQKKLEARRDTIVDATIGVSGICPVHHVKMGVQRVPIAYGLLIAGPTSPPFHVEKRDFPFARSYWPGGCIVDGASPRRALIYICTDCQRAEKKWITARKTK